jgi:hypothetical protein
MPKETLSSGEFLRVQDIGRTMIHITEGTIRLGDTRMDAKSNVEVEAPRFWEWIPTVNPDLYIYAVEDSTFNLKANPSAGKGADEGQIGDIEP